MTQQTNTTNWVIQGSNGQPQMIKLMQPSVKSFSGIMTSAMTGQPVKIIKTSPTTISDESQQGIHEDVNRVHEKSNPILTERKSKCTREESTNGDEKPTRAPSTKKGTKSFSVHEFPKLLIYTTSVSTNQVLRAIAAPKVVTKTIPIHVNKLTPGLKTIKLTSSQMQGYKLTPTSTPTKLQFSPQLNPTSGTVPVYTTQSSPATKNISPPILTRKRQDHVELEYAPESKRSRKSEKVGKGLRHFSMKVCEKVKQKGTTTYNEVADELVTEYTNAANNALTDQYDQKNIRRRVYDALNVLMAMNIISKEKKEIRWIGLPTNSLQECHQLEKELQNKLRTIIEKERQLNELILNQIAFKNLAQRNRESERLYGTPSPNSFIQLPFIVVNTNKKTVINCSISNDKMEYLFQFNDKFEINDDMEILKSIGMLSGLDTGTCTQENLEKIRTLIPESLWPYLDKIANGRPHNLDNILEEARAGNSAISSLNADEFVETRLDEENSRQSSSYDPLSPSPHDYSEEEAESDLSSDNDIH